MYSKKQPCQLAREETDLLTMDWDTHISELASTGIFKITMGLSRRKEDFKQKKGENTGNDTPAL